LRNSWVFPLLVVVLIRALFTGLLYESLGGPGKLRLQFMEVIPLKGGLELLYLFSAWDTGHYVGIAQSWYPASLAPQWAFFPLYPAAIRLLTWISIEPLLGAFIIATAAGLVSVLVYQKVAEIYVPKPQASLTTLLYFLLPPVLVFSGVSYSEPLFLLFTLLTWHYHVKGADLRAGVMASLASLTRPTGILIAIPLAYECIRRRRGFLHLALPFLAVGGWALYAYQRTGNPLTILVARSQFWLDQNALAIQTAFLRLLGGDLGSLSMLAGYSRIIVEGLVFMVFILVLCWRAWGINRALGLYAFSSTLAIASLGFVTSPFSLPRYLVFIFPLGLSLNTRRRPLLAAMIAVFLVLDYLAWWAFLTDRFT